MENVMKNVIHWSTLKQIHVDQLEWEDIVTYRVAVTTNIESKVELEARFKSAYKIRCPKGRAFDITFDKVTNTLYFKESHSIDP